MGRGVLGGGVGNGGVNGINKAGQIVGVVSTSNCGSCAFVADPCRQAEEIGVLT